MCALCCVYTGGLVHHARHEGHPHFHGWRSAVPTALELDGEDRQRHERHPQPGAPVPQGSVQASGCIHAEAEPPQTLLEGQLGHHRPPTAVPASDRR